LLIDKVAIPAVAACLMVVGALPPESGLVYTGINVSFVPLMLVSLYFMASITAVSGYSRLFLASTALAACCIAMLAGSVLAWSLPSDNNLSTSIAHVVTNAYYALLLVCTSVALWRGLVCSGSQGISAALGQEVSASDQESAAYRARVAGVAAAHGLTVREQEIAEYLGRGYNAANISQALLISNNTTRTHMRNIYRKLGVNSQKELLLLLNR
jgi:DNA-binding CsgD family transcriptional regulator